MTINEQHVPLVIIGAGPGGLAAAIKASELGVESIVLDMYPQSGGQYYHLPTPDLHLASARGITEEGLRLVEVAQKAGAQIWQNVEVWAIYPEKPYLICLTGGEVKRLRADMIIIATGAFERAVPFPGWTLPGVMTTGAALALMKNQRILPGRRILLAGSGLLQFPTAAYLVEAGADVEMVLELRRKRTFLRKWKSSLTMSSHLDRMFEGLGYFLSMWTGKVRMRTGCAITRAIGSTNVEAAAFADVDKAGYPISGTEHTIEVDTILSGYGLIPSNRLSMISGCKHVFHPQLHSYVPIRNEWMQTTVPEIYVAGDAAGISGKQAAIIEGKIAAVAVALQMERINQKQAMEQTVSLRKKLVRERDFAQAMADLFGYLPGLSSLLEDDTVVCRCENITLNQIKQAVADGADSVAGVKNHSRAGMGWCQGRMCIQSVAQIISQELQSDLERASRHTIRPPLFPVQLEDLLED